LRDICQFVKWQVVNFGSVQAEADGSIGDRVAIFTDCREFKLPDRDLDKTLHEGDPLVALPKGGVRSLRGVIASSQQFDLDVAKLSLTYPHATGSCTIVRQIENI
jgi:hypothetical protein